MMKTSRFFLLLTLMFGFAGGIAAQNTDNATLTATALVLTAVDVTNLQDLNFGSIAQGTTKTVGLDGVVTGPTQQGTETVGIFSVTADQNSSVSYTLATPSNLTSGANNLPITFLADYRLVNNLSPVGTTAIQNISTVLTMPADQVFFYIGGTIDAGGATPPPRGTYTGTVTLTVTYN